MVYSFIDLVGFDEQFTGKIMEGSSFAVHNTSMFNREEEGINEQALQKLISDCNDNNLYSLRNLLLAIENENEIEIQQTLEQTSLARVVFAKLI